MTGMMTALAFAYHGVKTSILERSASEKFPEDVRTTAFTMGSKRFLEEVGIWKLLETQAGSISDIYIVDNKSPRMLHLDSEEGESKGHIVPNMFIKDALYKAVKSHPLIEISKDVDYGIPYQDGDKVVIPLAEYEIKSDLLLVCEGRGSALKDLFEYRVDKNYGQGCMVLVAEHEKDHEGCAVEHFMPSGPFATLPMHEPKMSSVVWTEKLEVAKLYSEMPKKELEIHLQERMGEFLGKVKIISNVQIFPLSARITKSYYKGNIVLVGDAAHSIHPLAGQGLNQGVKDIKELVGIVQKRLKLGLEIDDIALKEYEKKRARDNYSMYLLTDNLNRIFSNNILPLSIFRKFGLSLLNEFPTLKKKIGTYGSGGW